MTALLRLRRRRTLIVTVCLLVLTVGFGLASFLLFVHPRIDTPGHADAVVVLAGGRGERLARARRLVASGVASTLAISNGTQPGWHDANVLCDRPQRFRVLCFKPAPDTTRGEAEMLRRLAHTNHWTRVVIVTSTYHVTRAAILARRCYHGHLSVVGATPRGGLASWIGRIAHEWGGLASALVHRDC